MSPRYMRTRRGIVGLLLSASIVLPTARSSPRLRCDCFEILRNFSRSLRKKLPASRC